MEEIFDTTLGPFIGLTLCLFGLCSFLAGQGVAEGWRPTWMAVAAGFGVAVFDRFLHWGLFSGHLWSLQGYLLDGLILSAYAVLGHRLTLAAKMVRQYPWLYEPAGPLGWRDRRPE
jgi:hypothetical protein